MGSTGRTGSAHRVGRLLTALVVTVAGLAGPTAGASEAPDRFDLAGGCWRLSGSAGAAAAPVRVVATDLARYLLVGADQRVLALDGAVPVWASAPSPAAEWVAEDRAGGELALLAAAGDVAVQVGTDGGLGVAPAADAGGLTVTAAVGPLTSSAGHPPQVGRGPVG